MNYSSLARLVSKKWLTQQSAKDRRNRERFLRLAVEQLEDRDLPSVLPAPLVPPVPVDASGIGGNHSSPSIAVDPLDPLRMAMAYVQIKQGGTIPLVNFAVSTDGGATWTAKATPANDADGVTGGLYAQSTDPMVAFDRNHSFYLSYLEQSTKGDSGEIKVLKFNLTTAGVVTPLQSSVVYQWAQQDPAFTPVLTVDNNVASFTDGGKSQSDPFAGDVYVSWATNLQAPKTNPPPTFCPNPIMIAGSSDGGTTFTSPVVFNPDGLTSTDVFASPQVVVSQGTVNGAVLGGEVFGVYNDVSTNAIRSNSATGVASASIQGTVGPINDATNPGGTGPHTPSDTFFTDSVSFAAAPGFTAATIIDNLTVTLDIVHPSLDQLEAVLIAPNGLGTFILFKNHTNADNTTNAGMGLSGINLGIIGGVNVGTTFDNNAPRAINDASAKAPYVGDFTPEQDGMTNIDVLPKGFTAAQATGIWTLKLTDFRMDSSPPTQSVVKWSLNFRSGMKANAQSSLVATSTVAGALTAPFPQKPAVSPNLGVGPDATIASDNTLGAFSRFQGRLYVTYVSGGPANYDIFLTTSDDAGKTWSAPQVVNDDASQVGISDGTRTQFEPSVAVDQYTGELAISFYDARFDPTDSRVATTVTTSVDGGASFSQQVFANQALIGTDAITLNDINLQPIPENQSKGNANAETTFGFGARQGIAFEAGVIHPAWSGNQNGGPDGSLLLDIYTSALKTAAGPRIVDSTMGPIGGITIGGITFNNTTAADGTPLLDGFAITFDRYVDPTTVNALTIQAVFRDTIPGDSLQPIPIGTVTPLDPTPFGATQFLIRFQTQQSRVGSYAYAVGPFVEDRIRRFDQSGFVSGNFMDQNANAISGEIPGGSSGGDAYSAPVPVGNGTILTAPFQHDSLPIIIPGPHVITTSVPNGSGDNVVVDGTVSTFNVTFDRDMDPTSFTPASILRLIGPTGLITGPFTVTPDADKRTFHIGFPTQTISGTYTITLASSIKDAKGEALDTNQNAGVDILFDRPTNGTQTITYTNSTKALIQPNATTVSKITITDSFVVQGLTLTLNVTDNDIRDLVGTLTAPDGTQIRLFTHVGGTIPPFANFTNTVFDDLANTPTTPTNPIQTGRAPFNASFNPQQPLSVLIGKAVAGTYTLTIVNNNPISSSGTLTSWSLNVQRAIPASGLGEDPADRPTESFRIFTLSAANSQSHTTWTPVGPASENNGANSGRVTGLAVDPSDSTGNTVYVGGASGGIWKTSNFLTTDPQGPTYIPLTSFGPTFAMNIGGIAVFGRNSDPNQSIIFASTGEGDTGSKGVGLIRSMDGGATWTLLDSTDNSLALNKRDHKFVGNASFKVLVDPKPSPSGQVLVYAAMSGPNGGIWISSDTGIHWTQAMAGDATDLVFAPSSADSTTGNLRTIYAAIKGQGVFISTNSGISFTLMGGGVGDPLIRDDVTLAAIAVTAPPSTPNGAKGRIVLAVPGLTGNRAEDLLYQGWLYAYVATPGGRTDGVYLTKDFGQNWTKVKIGILPLPPLSPKIPTNDDKAPDVDILGNDKFIQQGNYDISLAVDPNNPSVIYLGGTADVNPPGYSLIRVDTTGIADPHAEVAFDNYLNDGGKTMVQTAGGVNLQLPTFPYGLDPTGGHFLNLVKDPFQPFLSNATLFTSNVLNFTNSGIRGATSPWMPIDNYVAGTTDQHRIITEIDPLTGNTRLILSDDQGVFTDVDAGDGTLDSGIGTAGPINGSRNGNLQIAQFYAGAVQPSQLAADVAGALFYGVAQDDGFPSSDSNILQTGNLNWNGPLGDGTDVQTDQTGSGTVYQYKWPCCGGGIAGTDFFQVNGVGRTSGLLLAGDDPINNKGEWPLLGGFNFAVNPVDGSEIVISSSNGNIFRTNTQGINWFLANSTGGNDGSNANALAYGAPDPADPTQQLDNFIYAGTKNGNVFVTFNGGGAWKKISTGLDGSAVQQIVTNPHRGTHEAYAVTVKGVYFMADSTSATASWVNITNKLFQTTHNSFNDPTLNEVQLSYLTTIAADYRFAILDDPTKPNGPVHPILYVGGEGGVYRSIDKGKTWTIFPDVTHDQAPIDGGYLPNAHVTRLSLAIGNINPTTGLPIAGTSPDLLVASTFGRGTFAIRLAPAPVTQEVTFSIRASDNQVLGQKYDAVGNPVGGTYLVAPGTFSNIASARDAAGNLALFGVDPYKGFVWELKLDSSGNPLSNSYTNIWNLGSLRNLAVTKLPNGNLDLFAVDPFINHVWGMTFNANDDPASPFNLLSKGGVATKLTAGHDGNKNPLLFTIDPFFGQTQEMRFDATGTPVTDFFNPAASFKVKQIDLGYDGSGNPELFAVDPYFGHVFYLNFDVNGVATNTIFLQAATGIVQSIAVGHDASSNPIVFSVGPNFQVFALRFDATGKPVGQFFSTGASVVSVTTLVVGYSGNGFPELFGLGLGDNQLYEELFDGSGNTIRTFNIVAPGAILQVVAPT